MTTDRYRATRARAIIVAAGVEQSLVFSGDLTGFEILERYDDPPYATLQIADARLPIAEQDHAAEDRPNVDLVAPAGPATSERRARRRGRRRRGRLRGTRRPWRQTPGARLPSALGRMPLLLCGS